MRHTSRLLHTGLCLLLVAGPLSAQDSKDKPASDRWPAAAKAEPGVTDLKKIADTLAELKTRVDQLESSTMPKAECAKMGETIAWLKGRVERMQDEMLALRSAGPVSTVTPAAAVAPKPFPEETVAAKHDVPSKLDAIAQKLDDLGRIKQQVDTHATQIADLQRKLDLMQDDVIRAQNKADKVEQDMARMRTQLELARGMTPSGGSDRRISSALPLPPDTAAPAPATRPAGYGTVRVVNSYLMPVNVVVDGRVIPLAVNESRNVDRPPGYFTYEVLGIQPNTLRTLSAGETMTLQVVPR